MVIEEKRRETAMILEGWRKKDEGETAQNPGGFRLMDDLECAMYRRERVSLS